MTAEGFNIANHANFASVNNEVSPLFGFLPSFTTFNVQADPHVEVGVTRTQACIAAPPIGRSFGCMAQRGDYSGDQAEPAEL